jgi:hypothetical protein
MALCEWFQREMSGKAGRSLSREAEYSRGYVASGSEEACSRSSSHSNIRIECLAINACRATCYRNNNGTLEPWFQLAAALTWSNEKPRNRPFISFDARLAESARDAGFEIIFHDYKETRHHRAATSSKGGWGQR